MSYGQNATLARDLAAINHAYFDLNKKMTVKAVAKSGSEQITTDYVAYMKGIDHYYMKSDGTEMLISSSVKVVLNKAMKSVMIESNAINTVADLPIQLFDTLTKLYSSVKHTLLNGGYEQYELEPIVSEVDKIVIVFNGQSKLLRSMRMNATGYDGEKSSIQVNYTYEKLKMSDIPPLTKYLVLDQGDARLNASYSSYRLINFLNR